MPRCHARSFAVSLLASPFMASVATVPAAATAPLTAFSALATLATFAALPSAAHAQAARPVPIPPQTLRGEMLFGMPPEVKLNDQATRLSPATRIRGQSNTLVMSATLSGQTWKVNYTLDPYTGLVQDVWLLTADEAARRWPTTREEATTWSFDPISQSWSKP